MARVLPVPAPASTHTGPRVARATSRCSGSSPASSASAVPTTASAICPLLPPPAASGRIRTAGRPWSSPVLQEPGHINDFKEAPRVSGQLTMYTTSWCGFCRNLKSQLGRAGIEIAEVDIERDPAAAEFVMSVNGGNQTVPTVVFPDGTALVNPSAAQVKAQLAASTG